LFLKTPNVGTLLAVYKGKEENPIKDKRRTRMRNIHVMAEYLTKEEIVKIYGESKDTLHLLSGITAVSTKYPNYPAS
jgi:hypothetical protein